MTRDPRYDILFEPVKIGPVTAKNRFYQVPHCSGMGYARPQTLHRAREINAEGGWAVVCTEYCSIHPSANDDPYPQCTLWDENDVKTLADMTERVHRHGALAGVELWYGGCSTGNHLTRENSLAPSSSPAWHGPTQTQAMDRTDIRNLRKRHRDAALRAKRAGFDIVYVYAAHGYLPAQFLSPVENRRTDEYGGSFENRARLIRELLEDTKEAVGDECGVAFRFAVDNLDRDVGVTHEGDGRARVEYLAEAGTELGGRVTRESGLPGLSEWARVRDHRIAQIRNLPNVEVYLDRRLDAAQVLEFGFAHTCIATGAKWRADGRGRFRFDPIDGCPHERVIAPDAVMDGAGVEGPVAVYDDDHFYLGGLIAEQLRLEGLDVLLVTTASCLSPETERTLEPGRIQTRALELGVELVVSQRVTGFDGDRITIACAYSGRESTRACRTLVPVTSREPNDDLYAELSSDEERLRDAGILSLSRIGDCTAPGMIAQAVFAGHRYARELGANDIEVDRDRVIIESGR